MQYSVEISELAEKQYDDILSYIANQLKNPQAVKNVLPSIGNELIMVIKETSLASTVDAGIGELMSVKKQITSATFINIPPFIVVAAMYFVVTFSLSKVVRLIERRLEARD